MRRRACVLLSALLALTLLMSPALAEGVIVIGGEESAASGGDAVAPMSGGDELTPGERVMMDDYAIEFVSAGWYKDEKLQQGWGLYFLTSSENGSERVRYDYPVGTHVPILITFEYTNMTMEDVSLLDRVSLAIEYDDQYVFDEFVKAQYNPNQLDKNGERFPSIEGVPVEPLLSVQFCFEGALPMIIRDTDAPLMAYLTVGEDTFEVDLREHIEFW